jgi:RNA polymerase sigma factor (sigma-70 family)
MTTRERLSKGLPYESILRRNAFKFGAYDEEIDDILQDVYIHVWERADNIDPKNLKAYLVTTSRNITLNRKGKDRVRYKHSPRVRADEVERRRQQAVDPETQLLKKERWPMLSDREQDLAELLYDEGLSKQEAAAQLGISSRTVHRWLANIKEKLSE